jgi:hypothetical protein
MGDRHHLNQAHLGFAVLLCILSVICCVSLVYRAPYQEFHVFYDDAKFYNAVGAAAVFALSSSLFIFADFSFGYFVGLYLYSMILSYLWISAFSDLTYDHQLGEFSAAISAAAFLVPALFVSRPMSTSFTMTEKAFERLLTLILLLAAATIGFSAVYNFRVIGIGEIYNFRNELSFPRPLNYLIGMTSNALLPFAFACFVMRNAWWRAGATLALLLLFYPITLAKLSLFAPIWLVAIALLALASKPKVATILSLLLPLLAGVVLIHFFPNHAYPYFQIVNFRMMAIPALAMDVYNDFFANHDLTYFCQMSFTKLIFTCPYQEPLSIVMEKAYHLGNFNASLFATEGIASVGPWLAPFSAFICGLVIALGNRVSAGLPARFILISGGLFSQILLNVPLTVALLTNGAAVLFLLWYITPRKMFE